MSDPAIAAKAGKVERDWTKGNTFRCFLSLAWALIINGGLWVIGSVVDMVWIGRLGSASIAGVGVAGYLALPTCVKVMALWPR